MERKWWTLIVVCVGTFMLLLDITIVNVALPRIAADLKANFSDIQWVIDAYALTLASVLLTMGTLADLLGRRLMFAIGLGLFSFTSLLCALSPSATFLIFARAFQGIGGAIMFATSLSLLAQEFQGRERGTAFGAWGATIAASAAVGPLLGGFLTEDFGWSSIFYINVPIGIGALLLTLAKVRESKDPEGRRIDWLGTVTFTGALFLFVFAVVRGNAEGWGSTLIISLFAGSVVLMVAFLVSQFLQDNAMFDVSLFRKPTFSGASIAAFTVSSSMFAMFLYLVLYLQTILGFSPSRPACDSCPFTVVSFFVAAASGNLSAKVPARVLLAGGLLLTGVGLLLMRGLTVDSGWTALLAGFIVAGAGVGLVNPTLASTAIGVVPPQRSGMASGINSTFRQVGIAVGHRRARGDLRERSRDEACARARRDARRRSRHRDLSRRRRRRRRAGPRAQSRPGERAHAAAAIHGAFAATMNEILLVGAIIALVGAVLSLALVRARDFVTYGSPEGEPEPAAAAAG